VGVQRRSEKTYNLALMAEEKCRLDEVAAQRLVAELNDLSWLTFGGLGEWFGLWLGGLSAGLV